jgi:hypothetical protein
MSGFPASAWRLRSFVFSVAVVALAVMGTSCGSGKSYKFNPVKGRVLLGTNPLTGGTIRFTNAGDSNLIASSPIASDGTFSLKTSTTTSGRTSAGAPEGTYQVIVSMPPPAPNRPFPSMTAPESYTVTAGDNDITVVLPVDD